MVLQECICKSVHVFKSVRLIECCILLCGIALSDSDLVRFWIIPRLKFVFVFLQIPLFFIILSLIVILSLLCVVQSGKICGSIMCKSLLSSWCWKELMVHNSTLHFLCLSRVPPEADQSILIETLSCQPSVRLRTNATQKEIYTANLTW